MANRIKVLYIAGDGRSGSTLLDLLLGQTGIFCSTGELSQIWQSAFLENYLCGCKIPLQDCEFWTAVVNQAFGGWHQINAEAVWDQWLHLNRLRHYPLVANTQLGRWFKHAERVKPLAQTTEKLYRAIAQVSGAKIIIDSSKSPMRGFALSQMAGIELFVVHLIRDSRAVAYSLQRKKIRPEVTAQVAYLGQLGPAQSAVFWSATHYAAAHLASTGSRYRLLRYEDLARQPQVILQQIADWVGVRINLDYFSDEHTVQIAKLNHTVAGNPFRFKRGRIDIRLDDEWQTQLPWYHRAVVSLLSFPLLRRYGYI